MAYGSNADVIALIRAIGCGDRDTASTLLDADPQLVSSTVSRRDEFFLEQCRAQVYAGDTALHTAAFAYDTELAARLIEMGADITARNRRGAQPLHSTTVGSPGSTHWDPSRQAGIITYLAHVGADPNAVALGGVTPLHRAVRNRCTAAVQALLRAGADPHRANDSGSTAFDLARWTTGRGGTGSAEARAEQQTIIELLANAT